VDLVEGQAVGKLPTLRALGDEGLEGLEGFRTPGQVLVAGVGGEEGHGARRGGPVVDEEEVRRRRRALELVGAAVGGLEGVAAVAVVARIGRPGEGTALGPEELEAFSDAHDLVVVTTRDVQKFKPEKR
jgi:3,4-dihydroxy-2-butanone 4-phosphate synthase